MILAYLGSFASLEDDILMARGQGGSPSLCVPVVNSATLVPAYAGGGYSRVGMFSEGPETVSASARCRLANWHARTWGERCHIALWRRWNDSPASWAVGQARAARAGRTRGQRQ